MTEREAACYLAKLCEQARARRGRARTSALARALARVAPRPDCCGVSRAASCRRSAMTRW